MISILQAAQVNNSGVPGKRLGTIRSYASPEITEQERQAFATQQRRLRYKLLDTAGQLLPGEHVSHCLAHAVNQPGNTAPGQVLTHYSTRFERAHEHNLFRCGSVWQCPVCSAKISAKRKEQLTTSLEKARAAGYSFYFLTLTLQHSRENTLRSTLDTLAEVYRKMQSGKMYQAFKSRYQLVGSVRGLEHTYSHQSGHHPHLHVIVISKLPQAEIIKAESELLAYYERYYNQEIEKRGLLTNEHTSKVNTTGDFSSYITKWSFSQELTSQHKSGKLPGHYNPWQLLHLVREGSSSYRAPFIEYAEAFKGKKQLVKHCDKSEQELKAILFPPEELTDEAIVQAPEYAESVLAVTITSQAHQAAVKAHGRAYVPRKLERVELAWKDKELAPLLEYLTQVLRIPISAIRLSPELLARCNLQEVYEN